jgi:hypothetical protein
MNYFLIFISNIIIFYVGYILGAKKMKEIIKKTIREHFKN